MLPSYPKIESLRAKQNNIRIKQHAASISPVLAQIKSQIQFEGSGNIVERHDDTVDDEKHHLISAEISAVRLQLEEFTFEFLDSKLKELAEIFARNFSELFFRKMDQVTEQYGNVVDAKGGPITEELFLQMIDKMHHTFNADGSWNAPVGIAGSDAFAAFAKLNEMDEEKKRDFTAKLNRLLEKKRDEFNHREAARILAG